MPELYRLSNIFEILKKHCQDEINHSKLNYALSQPSAMHQSDAFTGQVSKPNIPSLNAPTRIDVLVGQSFNIIGNESKACLKLVNHFVSKIKIFERKGEQIIKMARLRR